MTDKRTTTYRMRTSPDGTSYLLIREIPPASERYAFRRAPALLKRLQAGWTGLHAAIKFIAGRI